jgi:hypothetical protein
MNEAIGLAIHEVKRFLSRKYRRRIALSRVSRRLFEWQKVSTKGKGYIPSHGFYIHDELTQVYKDLSSIL